jgi:hypothetical protein
MTVTEEGQDVPQVEKQKIWERLKIDENMLPIDGSMGVEIPHDEFAEEILALSMDYPQYLFQLDETGEDRFDIWRLFIQNGQMHKAQGKIVFPTLDAVKAQL